MSDLKTRPTQQQMLWDAHRKLAATHETFMHILPSLTRRELEQLIAKRPEVWSRFSGYLDKLP